MSIVCADVFPLVVRLNRATAFPNSLAPSMPDVLTYVEATLERLAFRRHPNAPCCTRSGSYSRLVRQEHHDINAYVSKAAPRLCPAC